MPLTCLCVCVLKHMPEDMNILDGYSPSFRTVSRLSHLLLSEQHLSLEVAGRYLAFLEPAIAHSLEVNSGNAIGLG